MSGDAFEGGLDTRLDVPAFARAVAVVTEVARRAGLVPPAFRSPPRRRGAARTIRRAGGGSVVAVRRADRPAPAVVADLVDGILVANDLPVGGDPGPAARAAGALRRLLLAETLAALEDHRCPPARSTVAGDPARVAERQTQAA